MRQWMACEHLQTRWMRRPVPQVQGGRKAETSGSLRERSPGSRSGCGGRGGNGFAWAALLRM